MSPTIYTVKRLEQCKSDPNITVHVADENFEEEL